MAVTRTRPTRWTEIVSPPGAHAAALGPSVGDDVDAARFVRAATLVRMGNVRSEEYRITRSKIVCLVGHRNAQRARQQHDRLRRPPTVRLTAMVRLRQEAQ